MWFEMNSSVSPVDGKTGVNMSSMYTIQTKANVQDMVPYFLVMSGIGLFGTFGNTMFLVSCLREKKLRTISNLITGHLALVDLLTCVTLIPWYLIILSGTSSIVSCQYAIRLVFLFPHLSMFTQCLISCYRYVCVTKPKNVRQMMFKSSLALSYLTAGWILSIGVVVIIAVFGETPLSKELQYCDISTDVTGSWQLIQIILVILSYAYFVIACVSYGKLVRYVRQSALPLKATNRRGPQKFTSLLFLLLVYVVSLLISPAILYIRTLTTDKTSGNYFDHMEQCLVCIILLNCCVNPLFYGYRIRHLKETVKGMLCPCTIVNLTSP